MIEELKDKLISVVKKAGYPIPDGFVFEQSSSEKFGDFSTNVAILIATKEKKDPKKVAEKIVKSFDCKDIEKVEIAGKGFINFFLKEKSHLKILKEILATGANYAKSDIGKGKKVLIEFISSNPTGPLHIGNARGGPIGETLSNVMSWLNYKIDREFYINDIGNQIQKFGETLAYWYIKKYDSSYHFPENGYPGDYLKSVSENIQKEQKNQIEMLKDEELIDFFIKEGLEKIIREMKGDVESLNIHFDRWVYESDFLNSGKSQQIVDELKIKGKTTEKEGAVWFSSPKYRDLSDRESVIVRSDTDKTLTYFASDIAYHKDKFDRGFNIVIDIWGANHHGHIARINAAMAALGYDISKLKIILYQSVRLKEKGETKQMGKRLGNYINIADLICKMKVPADVFKYMIISQNSSTIIDFDLDLALEQSEKNPVFYLQYAYARISSILRKGDKKIIAELEKISRGEGELELKELEALKDKKELKLIQVLSNLPEVLIKISNDFQIQALPYFATQVARAYHDFYTNCQVLSDDEKRTKARLLLVLATRNVLKISLSLMGIKALEKM